MLGSPAGSIPDVVEHPAEDQGLCLPPGALQTQEVMRTEEAEVPEHDFLCTTVATFDHILTEEEDHYRRQDAPVATEPQPSVEASVAAEEQQEIRRPLPLVSHNKREVKSHFEARNAFSTLTYVTEQPAGASCCSWCP